MANNLDNIANTGKQFACNLYRTIPSAIVDNPISDLLKLSWDSLCADDPLGLPDPPSVQYQGGQCDRVAYEVSEEFAFTFRGQPLTDNRSQQLYGAIGAVSYAIKPNGLLYVYVGCHGVFGGSYTPNEITVETETFQTQGLEDLRLINVSVRRLDGQPDNCGNPPTQYPPAPPTPPGGYTSPPTSIVYNDGTDFNVVFNLQPPRRVDNALPPSICLTVVLLDTTFDLCYQPDGTFRLTGGSDVEGLLRELQDDLREFREEYARDNNPLPPDEDPTLTPQPLDGDSGGEEDAEGIQWLLVVLTEFPDKSQFGNPTVFWGGWVTFRVNGAYTERQQISYERSLFKAPTGADGYGVTFTNLSKGNVVSYVTQQSQEV